MSDERLTYPDGRISVAPMMDWTDRHDRYFLRLISRRALLYTEMVTTGALLHGDVARHLDYDAAEHPVALQLGGSEPDAMAESFRDFRERGFSTFQIKLGHDIEVDQDLVRTLMDRREPGEIWVGDVNGAWRRDEAVRFSRSVEGLDLYLEQPCPSYEECLSVRAQVRHPVKLDESLTSVADVQRALRDDAMDAMSLKVSKFGGLTQSRVIRDLCVASGIPMTIEDAWGSGIATAAYAHLAASTPPACLLNTTDLHNYNTVQLAHGAPAVANGRMTLSERPGLGVEPDLDQLRRDAVYS